jgi:hypothetical protein
MSPHIFVGKRHEGMGMSTILLTKHTKIDHRNLIQQELYPAKVIVIAEPVMGPIIAILIGAVLIGFGVYTAAPTFPGIGIVLSIGGVATILVGLVMLVGLAKGNREFSEKKK